MRFKLMAGIVLVSCLITTAILVSQASRRNSLPRGVESVIYDAGIVSPGELVKHTFLVENKTAEPLVITKIEKDCSCTTPEIEEGAVIPAHGKQAIPVTFDTNGRSGFVGTRLFLFTDARDRDKIMLTIHCKVREALEYYPRTIDFGTMLCGQSATRELTLWDGQFEDLKIIGIQADGLSLKTSFEAFVGGSDDGDRDGVPGWLVRLELPTDVPVGGIDAKVTIKTDSSVVPEIVVPIKGAVVGDLYVHPSRIAYGVTQERNTAFFTIYRRGTSTATIREVRTDSKTICASAKAYRENDSNDPNIVAGGSVVIDKKVAPAGVPVRANVYISTTSSSVPEIVIPVTFMLTE